MADAESQTTENPNLLPDLPEGWMLITLNGFSGGFQAEIFHFDQGKRHGCGPTPRSAVVEAIEGKHHHKGDAEPDELDGASGYGLIKMGYGDD